MARTNANHVGPSPRGTAVTTITEQLDSQIQRSFKDFHNHSKECRACRNPILAYEQGRDLCEVGRGLSVNITKLLYKKAEHVPHGTFTVQYKQGWEAVDGLVRIISHYNQGYYSNEIVDVKRIPKVEEPVYRGSQFEEDLRRREIAAGRHRSSSHRTSPTIPSKWGDPRTSLLDAPSGRTQAESSPASSNRSVHFDSYIRVREFEKNT